MKKFIMVMFALILSASFHSAQAVDLQLGAGDVLKISVFGNPDLLTETRISDTGAITFPLIGEVNIAGLSTSVASSKIAGLLEKGGYVRKPQVNILVTVLQSQQISVLGQVNRPGRYPLDGTRTLTGLLALAGGISPDGGDKITLIREKDGKATRSTLDLYEITHSGESLPDLGLSSSDILYVERADKFYIYGEVQRPGAYRLERGMTLLEALSIGGGLTPKGTEWHMKVKRRNAEGKMEEVQLDKGDILLPDDIVYVKESWF